MNHEDLPLPSARQRAIGHWGPETSPDEKREFVLLEEEKRIRTLMFLTLQQLEQDPILHDLLCYMGGATLSEQRITCLTQDILQHPDLLQFFRRAEDYIGQRMRISSHVSVRDAVTRLIQERSSGDSIREAETQAEREVISRIKFALEYFRTEALRNPLTKEFALYFTKKKDGGAELASKAAHDPQARQAFVALDEIVCEDKRTKLQPELLELESLLTEI